MCDLSQTENITPDRFTRNQRYRARHEANNEIRNSSLRGRLARYIADRGWRLHAGVAWAIFTKTRTLGRFGLVR